MSLLQGYRMRKRCNVIQAMILVIILTTLTRTDFSSEQFLSQHFDITAKQSDNFSQDLHPCQKMQQIDEYENHINYNGRASPLTNATKCSRYDNSENCMPQSYFVKQFWNKKRGAVLYGTAYTQQEIIKNQNPRDCKTARYLLFKGHHLTGIGSILHIHGHQLGIAIEEGRVLLYENQKLSTFTESSKKMLWTDNNFCPGVSELHDCYFEPLSRCTWDDAMNSMKINESNVRILDWAQTSNAIQLTSEYPWAFVPTVFRKMLTQCSNIPATNHYYWWRAQTVAFFVRPNEKFAYALESKRKQFIADWKSQIPPGAISIHVRHGTKIHEMKEITWKQYKQAAMNLVSGKPFLIVPAVIQTNNTRRWRTWKMRAKHPAMFISTEDNTIIDNSRELKNWTVMYDTRVLRRNADLDADFLQSMHNLELALECDAFIGTFGSNWNRLIDELRMTLAAKADAPYVEVGVVGSGGISNWYNWR